MGKINRTTPAYYVFEKLGGVTALSRELGVDYTLLYRWHQRVDSEGFLGNVPDAYVAQILKIAKRKGVKLKLEDMFNGVK